MISKKEVAFVAMVLVLVNIVVGVAGYFFMKNYVGHGKSITVTVGK